MSYDFERYIDEGIYIRGCAYELDLEAEGQSGLCYEADEIEIDGRSYYLFGKAGESWADVDEALLAAGFYAGDYDLDSILDVLK